MEAPRVIKIGFLTPANEEMWSNGENRNLFISFFSHKTNFFGRILLTLVDYLVKYSQKFDEASFYITVKRMHIFSNGTLEGMIKYVNLSEVDITVQPFIMSHESKKFVDFSYPYELYSSTFFIRKPEYKPQIFGIFQMFPLSIWIAVASVLICLTLAYFVILRRKYSFAQILFHVSAVLLKQSSIIRPSSVAENLLIYSWVIGALVLCFAYESVFLSFLAIPPINAIKTASELAAAIEKGTCQCVANPRSGLLELLLSSNQEKFKTIGSSAQNNDLDYQDVVRSFLNKTMKQNVAILVPKEATDSLEIHYIFVSEDNFLESMGAMMVGKGFCCKKLLETFVHKLVSSGLYLKYVNDRSFLTKLPQLLKHAEKSTSERKLTITDVAPAFIFLLASYFISVLVLIGEMLLHRWDKRKRLNNSRVKDVAVIE